MNIVLILEDDPSSLSVLKWVLEGEYRVRVVETPLEGVRICQSEPPDLLIADNLLKASMSGLQTASAIYADRPEMRFLIISGTPPEGWKDQDFACFEKLITKNASLDFLQKPFTKEALRGKVDGLMKGVSASSAMQTILTQAAFHRESQESWRHNLLDRQRSSE